MDIILSFYREQQSPPSFSDGKKILKTGAYNDSCKSQQLPSYRTLFKRLLKSVVSHQLRYDRFLQQALQVVHILPLNSYVINWRRYFNLRFDNLAILFIRFIIGIVFPFL